MHNEWRGTFEEFEESIEFGELDLFLKIDPARTQHDALNASASRSAGSSSTPSETISSSSDSYVSASSSKAPNRSVSHSVKSVARLAQPKAPSHSNLAPALPFAPAGSGRRKDHDAETFLTSLGISDLNLTEEELNEILEAGKSTTNDKTASTKEENGSDASRKYPSSLGIGSSKPPVQRTYIPSAGAGVKPLQFAKMGNGTQRSATSSMTPSARYNDSQSSSKLLAAEAQASISSRSFSSLKLRDAVSRGDKLEDAFKSTKEASANGHKEHIVGREDLDELMSSLGLDNVEMTEEEADAFLLDGSIPSGLNTHASRSKYDTSVTDEAVKNTVETAPGKVKIEKEGEAENNWLVDTQADMNGNAAADARKDELLQTSHVNKDDIAILPTKESLSNSKIDDIRGADKPADIDNVTPVKSSVTAQSSDKGSIADVTMEGKEIVSLAQNTPSSTSMEPETFAPLDNGDDSTTLKKPAAASTSLTTSSDEVQHEAEKAKHAEAEDVVQKGVEEADKHSEASVTNEVADEASVPLMESIIASTKSDTPEAIDSHALPKDQDDKEVADKVAHPAQGDKVVNLVESTSLADARNETTYKDTSHQDAALGEAQKDMVVADSKEAGELESAETPSKRPIPLQIQQDASNFSVLDNLDLLDDQTEGNEGLGLLPEPSLPHKDDPRTAKLEPAHVITAAAAEIKGQEPHSIPLPSSAAATSPSTSKDVPAVEFASPTTIPSSPSAAAALSSSPQNPANLSPVTARRRQSTSASRSSSRRAMDIPRRGSNNSMQSEGSSSSPHHSGDPSFLTSPVMSPKSSDDRKSPKSAAKKFFNKMRRSSSNSKKNDDEEEEDDPAAQSGSSYSYDPNQKRISAILREADAAMEGLEDEDVDLSHDSIQSDHAFNLDANDKVIESTAPSSIA